jgi:hypothetical protein
MAGAESPSADRDQALSVAAVRTDVALALRVLVGRDGEGSQQITAPTEFPI